MVRITGTLRNLAAGGRAGSRKAATNTRISDEALDTSKLLIEFLHATYATRRQRLDAPEGLEGAGPLAEAAERGAASSTALSAHAIRAAIHIYQHGERTVGQLASGLGISYGWASRVVEELENAHFVVRGRDDSDHRIVRVRLEPHALETVERAYAWRGEAVAKALEPLSEDERRAVRLFLRRVIDLLREQDPDARHHR